MDPQPLREFVRDALARGVPRDQIARGLRTAGWPEREIEEALSAFVDAGLPLPVPRCRASGRPREAFLHLLMFFSLGVWVTALGSLLFDFINLRFPLPGEGSGGGSASLRYGVASLAVAFPVFGLTLRRVRRDLAANPARAMNSVRRWLSYLALFVAALILVGDGIALLVQFLGGDLTLRFALKFAVIAALAGGVTWWLLRGLRELAQPALPALPYALCALVFAVGLAALWQTGGPLQARFAAQDAQRLRDLRSIHYSVHNFYERQKRLPSSLAECDTDPQTFIEKKNDPVSGRPYGYKVLGADRFTLTAEFRLPSGAADPASYVDPASDGFWQHGAGDHVFTVELGPPLTN
ncbi:MAG: hypothetical protein JHC52_11445 [Chthoniobacterales bacterium]|nr:hypothetical protein [Chthoniobacterales bacterium]